MLAHHEPQLNISDACLLQPKGQRSKNSVNFVKLLALQFTSKLPKMYVARCVFPITKIMTMDYQSIM